MYTLIELLPGSGLDGLPLEDIVRRAPEVCPVCDHKQSYFQLKPENY